MSPTPSTNSSSAHSPAAPAADFRVVRKRNRVPLSCSACRARKLKCNRSAPCENCVRRGDSAECSYAAPVGPRRRSANNSSSTSTSSGDDMQSRIDRLEGLVLSLMTTGAQAPGLAAARQALERSGSKATNADGDDDVDEMIKDEDEDEEEGADERRCGAGDVEKFTQTFGAMKVAVAKNEEKAGLYHGDSHWHMVLADIKEVRIFWKTFQKNMQSNAACVQGPPPTNPKSVALLYPQYPSMTDSELRSALPSRSQIEALINRFFFTTNPAKQLLHQPTFRSQLQTFFANPSAHSTSWIALLYVVLGIATLSYICGADEPSDWTESTRDDMEALYRQRTVQSIVAAGDDYTKIPAYLLETMVLYLHLEHAARGDFDVSLWLIAGNACRLAMRAGYHRDPAQFRAMDALSCEMRRRVWLDLRLIDILFSNQLSLPSMIKSRECDTRMPSNLFDDDLGPTSDPDIPPPEPQPDNVPTPVSHVRAKGRLALLLGEIIDETQGLSAPKTQYSTIIDFDSQLRAAMDAIAPHFRVKSRAESRSDDAALVLMRYHLEIIGSKVACVLHRRYINLGNRVQRYALSRIRGVNAAMRLLELQDMLKKDCEPGGKLSTLRWDVSGMQRADYVLGAMVVCLDLAFIPRKSSHDSSAASFTPPSLESPHLGGQEELKYTRPQMMSAVMNCMRYLEGEAKVSMDAYKAAGVLRVMIDKLRKREERERLDKEASSAFGSGGSDQEGGEEHSAALTLGMLSAGLGPNAALFNAGGATGSGMTPGRETQTASVPHRGLMFDEPMSPFTQMFGTTTSGTSGPMDVPDNVDWMEWDRYLQPNTGSALDTDLYFPTGFSPQPILGNGSQQPLQQDGDGINYGYTAYMGNDGTGG